SGRRRGELPRAHAARMARQRTQHGARGPGRQGSAAGPRRHRAGGRRAHDRGHLPAAHRRRGWAPVALADRPGRPGPGLPAGDRLPVVVAPPGQEEANRGSACGAPRSYNAGMRIGPYPIEPKVILAPMAGVTDKPFRVLCKRLGAGLAVSEMTTSDPRFWNTTKSLQRMDHAGEPDPVSVQIAGTVPALMAEAARHNVAHGAQLVDINMGCPAKKVCNAWAGSALMRDERLVAAILEAVVAAVDVPVTLK